MRGCVGVCFFFQAEDGIRDYKVTGVQTCALPIFGEAPVQRCLRHKERNVTEHLPERDRPNVQQRLRRAWALDDHKRALDQLRLLAAELDRLHPGAAGSLREGIEETLTLTR